MREIRVQAVVQLPRVPNFLLIEGQKSDGAKLDIADIPLDSLREIGREWTEALVARSLERLAARHPITITSEEPADVHP